MESVFRRGVEACGCVSRWGGQGKGHAGAWPFEISGRSTAVQTPPASANLRCWKHSRQKTGRPCVGRKGTVVSLLQAEQFVVVSTRSRAIGPDAGRDARLALQPLHRLGSFLKFLSAKNSCSPAVQMNSVPQSTQCSDLSWNSIGPTSHQPLAPPRLRRSIRPARSVDPTWRGRLPGGILLLLRLATLLLPGALSSERLFGAPPIARLQVERMLLDILDDI